MNCSKKNILRLICVASVIVIALLLVVDVTLSWIETANSPVFQSNQIQLKSSPGLIMTLNGKQADIIDLNKYINDPQKEAFILSEASSYDGEIVYVREVNTGEEVKVKLADDGDKNSKYIDFTFELTAEGDCDIYLGDKDKLGDDLMTYIKKFSNADSENALKPVRVSLKYEYLASDGKTVLPGGVTTIFAVDKSYSTEAIVVVDNTTHLLTDCTTQRQILHSFDEYFYNASAPGQNKWFTLHDGETATINLKIWLEGCDVHCIDPISGSQLEMKLTFFTPQLEE